MCKPVAGPAVVLKDVGAGPSGAQGAEDGKSGPLARRCFLRSSFDGDVRRVRATSCVATGDLSRAIPASPSFEPVIRVSIGSILVGGHVPISPRNALAGLIAVLICKKRADFSETKAVFSWVRQVNS